MCIPREIRAGGDTSVAYREARTERLVKRGLELGRVLELPRREAQARYWQHFTTEAMMLERLRGCGEIGRGRRWTSAGLNCCSVEQVQSGVVKVYVATIVALRFLLNGVSHDGCLVVAFEVLR